MGLPVPSLKVERSLWKQGHSRVAGVDEVGMGCLGGPVVSAAVVVPVNARMIRGVRDSKMLTPQQRDSLAVRIRRQVVSLGIGAASVREIERLNILHASRLAMCRALARLGAYDHALIDGRKIIGLALGPHTTIVDGDATCYAIACASIVAKVTRDRLMRKLAARYPGYGWEHNVGYSTPAHKQALASLGPTPFHRRTYIPVKAVLPQGSDLDVALPEVVAPAGVKTMLAGAIQELTTQRARQADMVLIKLSLDRGGELTGMLGGTVLYLEQILSSIGDAAMLCLEVAGREEAEALGRLLASHIGANGAVRPLGQLGPLARSCKVVGASFRLDAVKQLGRVAPAVPRCMKFAPGSNLPGMLVACRYTGAGYAQPCFDQLDKIAVDGLRRAGLQVISPPAASLDEARRFIALGVDVLSAETPELLAAALAKQTVLDL